MPAASSEKMLVNFLKKETRTLDHHKGSRVGVERQIDRELSNDNR